MGLVYLPTWMLDFCGFHAGKYTSPMDPMGMLMIKIFIFTPKLGKIPILTN